MAEVVVMPRLGSLVQTCLITSWRVAVGDTVTEGMPLCDIETDQAIAFSLPARTAGIIHARLAESGSEIAVGAPLLIIGQPGEDVSGLLRQHGLAVPPRFVPTPTAESPAPPIWAREEPAGGSPASPAPPPAEVTTAPVSAPPAASAAPIPSAGPAPSVTGVSPASVGQVPPSVGQAPLSGGQAPLSVGQVPPSVGQVPLSVGQVPLSVGQVSPSVGQVSPSVGQVSPSAPSTASPSSPAAPVESPFRLGTHPVARLAGRVAAILGHASGRAPRLPADEQATGASDVTRPGGASDSAWPAAAEPELPAAPAEEESPLGPPEVAGETTAPVGPKAVSPRARELAAVYGLSVDTLEGSGPRGRVIERDVLAAVSGGRKSAGFSVEPAETPAPRFGLPVEGEDEEPDDAAAAVAPGSSPVTPAPVGDEPAAVSSGESPTPPEVGPARVDATVVAPGDGPSPVTPGEPVESPASGGSPLSATSGPSPTEPVGETVAVDADPSSTPLLAASRAGLSLSETELFGDAGGWSGEDWFDDVTSAPSPPRAEAAEASPTGGAADGPDEVPTAAVPAEPEPLVAGASEAEAVTEAEAPTVEAVTEAEAPTVEVVAEEQAGSPVDEAPEADVPPAEEDTTATPPAEDDRPATSPAEDDVPATPPAEEPMPATSPGAEEDIPAPSPAEEDIPATSPAEEDTPATSPAERALAPLRLTLWCDPADAAALVAYCQAEPVDGVTVGLQSGLSLTVTRQALLNGQAARRLRDIAAFLAGRPAGRS